MICTTCGRDNPGQLVFCQECGQRLSRRVAAPTPPLGVAPAGVPMPPSPLAATALAPLTGSAPAEPAPPPARRLASPSAVRPAAPEVRSAPRADPAPPTDSKVCPHCGGENQAAMRFCVACGKALVPAAAPSHPSAARPRAPAIDLSKTVQTPPPVHDPTPAPVAAAQAVAAGRVLDVGTAAPPPSRFCPRCRAPSDGAAQFCRLCGAPLAEGPVVRPTPPPLAQVPAPVAAAGIAAAAAPAAVAAPRSTVAVARSVAPRGSIVIVARDGGEGPAYPLGESTDIGRTEGTILLADDAYISPRHARISLRGQAYFLRDLGSTNGVYVRLPFVTSRDAERDAGPAGQGPGGESGDQPLKDQDLFLVGQQVLRFEVVKDAEEGFGVASDNGTLLFGTPASPRYARLLQRTVEGVTRDVFNVRRTDTILGRESGDIVFTDDPFLSRRHALLRVHLPSREAPGQERRYTLADLGSSNGTFLKVSEEVRLRHGDQFRIGQQLFRFDLDAAHGGPARA